MRVCTALNDARASGAKRYFTGKPCKKGHVAERMTGCSTCVECRDLAVSEFDNRNPDYRKEYSTRPAVAARRRHLVNAHYRANTAIVLAEIRAWKANNQDYVRALAAVRRARIRCADGRITVKQIRTLLEAQKNTCPICHDGLTEGYHLDHMIPVSRDGTNDITNIQLLCPTCNLSKGAKTPAEFVEFRRNG